LPVVQSSKFELVVNLHAAKLVGITVPPSLIGVLRQGIGRNIFDGSVRCVTGVRFGVL